MKQKFMTKAIEKQLIKNHLLVESGADGSKLKPVVKFFGGGACTWLITEYNKEENIFFGLADLGMGSPELGYMSVDELQAVKFPPFGLPIERDYHYKTDKTLDQIASESRITGHIS